MKTLLSTLLFAGFITLNMSCEKCSTCTSISEDPQTEGQTITQEVCGRGRSYTDQITIYERTTDWTCEEKN